MQAKQLNQKLSIGSRVNLDGQWHIIADREDDEWVLLSITHNPREVRCREFGVEVFASSSKYHGNVPEPIPVTRMADPLDTVFVVFMEYIGNTQKPFIEWGYLINAGYAKEGKGREMLISRRDTEEFIIASEERPVKKVFTFECLQLETKYKQFWKSQQNTVKCKQ